jgi:hypothetical protein
MRRLVALAVAALLLASGCSAGWDLGATHCPASRKLLPQGAADYIDFVQHGGITYQADTRPVSGRALGEGDLGAQVAMVRCKLADHMVEDPGQRYLDAAYLDKGTALYAVKGYRPTFRLAARRDGELVLFEAAENPRARTWADLLDPGGKVRWIGVNDGSNRPRAEPAPWTCQRWGRSGPDAPVHRRRRTCLARPSSSAMRCPASRRRSAGPPPASPYPLTDPAVRPRTK